MRLVAVGGGVLPRWLSGKKNLPAKQETQVQSLGPEDLLKEEVATHSSIIAWRIHGQRSLAGYKQWGHKELDTTEHTHPCCSQS